MPKPPVESEPHHRVSQVIPTIGVLISGRGSNLQAVIDAIHDGRLAARLGVVISNRADAPGLSRAASAGIETLVMPHRDAPSREAYDRALVDVLRGRQVSLVCLAGFMRLLGPVFCDAFPQAILNVHPSLLPAFRGVDAQQQALDAGATVSGATVHFVTPDLDAGPIVLQSAVPVVKGESREALSARILDQEHRLLPEAIRLVLAGRVRVVRGQAVLR